MRCLIVINSLQAGGAERAASKLFEDLNSDQIDAYLLVLNSKVNFYKPNPVDKVIHFEGISLQILEKFRIISRIPKIRVFYKYMYDFFRIRRTVNMQSYDSIIVFEGHVGIFIRICLLGTNQKICISERINPDPHIYKHSWLSAKLKPYIYKSGVSVAVQTKGFQNWLKSNWKVIVQVIPNHLSDRELENNLFLASTKLGNKNQVIAVGRYASQKDYETLLQAWKIVEQLNSNAFLNIYGAGDSNSFQKYATNLGLKKIAFNAEQENIVEKMIESRLLVSTSKVEGFPNVVLEAMSCGLPVISTKSTDVITELSSSGGVIAVEIGDFKEIAKNILMILADQDYYADLRKKNLEISKNYSWSNVKHTWMQFIS